MLWTITISSVSGHDSMVIVSSPSGPMATLTASQLTGIQSGSNVTIRCSTGRLSEALILIWRILTPLGSLQRSTAYRWETVDHRPSARTQDHVDYAPACAYAGSGSARARCRNLPPDRSGS